MKHRGLLLILVSLAMVLNPLVAAAASNQPSAASANDAQMLEWQKQQQMLENEYNVCVEHCGSSADCENKCSKARSAKLGKEHTRIFGKSMPKAN
jgi:hypothetical protein